MILFASSDSAGGGRVRSAWPAGALRARGRDVRVLLPDDPFPIAAGVETIVLHRPLSRTILGLVQLYKAAGTRVLCSEDDDMGCIPRTNQWQATQEQIETHDQAISEADGIIVTTKGLQEVYGSRAKQCYLVPNYLPKWVQTVKSNAPRDGWVRVGWAGTIRVHLHDLGWITPVAEEMRRGAMFSNVGDLANPSCANIWREPIESWGWVDRVEDYYALMARADIGIVPLDNTESRDFNTSKSWYKALEYMTLGKPVVATNLPEQAALIVHGVTGFLADTPEEFAGYVQTLVKDHDTRARMGAASQRRAQEYSLENHIEEWEQAIAPQATEELPRAGVSQPSRERMVSVPR